jgi:hypothetical protein
MHTILTLNCEKTGYNEIPFVAAIPIIPNKKCDSSFLA